MMIRENLYGQKTTQILPDPFIRKFISTSDGGFVFVVDGNIVLSNEKDENRKQKTKNRFGVILKCDSGGNLVWKDQLEYIGGGQIEILIETLKGDILTVGCCRMNGNEFITDPNGGYTDLVLMKYDKSGRRVMQRTFGGSDFESFSSAVYSPNVGLVVLGDTQSCDRDITKRKEIAKERGALKGLINLDISKDDISDILEKSEFKGYRFDGALKWIMKTIQIIQELA